MEHSPKLREWALAKTMQPDTPNYSTACLWLGGVPRALLGFISTLTVMSCFGTVTDSHSLLSGLL